ncbi:Hypothetical predicted protein [Pelobates cultripes]|uniref:Uncharacterized protein n=1 Tax=Pelobates cultripes TaxID=61616 RepID=A0AAD1T480_PELCU|nr:Hypothetical predicted protein [Pelobates cultripes]
MGLPKVRGYYQAAQIAPLLTASNNCNPTAWTEIEKNHAKGLALPTLAWLPKTHRPKTTELLPTTALTLSIWDNYRKKMGATTTLAPAIPIEALRLFIPDFNYKLWQRHGVETVSQLLQNNKLKTFSDLGTEYTLPSTTTFSYLQIQSWTNSQPAQPETQIPGPHWYKIIQICTKTKQAKKLISLIYTSEHTQCRKQPPSFKSAWEKNIGHQLTEEQWQDIYQAHK